MRRTTAIITLVALFSTLGLIGCGRKAKPDSDESAGAASSSTPPRRAPSNPNPQPPTGDPQPPGVLPFGTGEPDPMRTEMDPTTPDPMAVTSPQPKVVPTPPVVSPKDPNPMTGVPPQQNPMPPPPAKDPPSPPVGVPPKEPEWPKEIGGRDARAFVKDLFDTDPATREIALKTLPNFGPPVRKATTPDGKMTMGKALLARMDPQRERDPGVRVAAYVCAAAVGFEDDADQKEAIRLLSIAVDQGALGGQTRLQAIQTLATFGPKAESTISVLVGQGVVNDPSHETRRSLAAALGQVAFDEKTGPSSKALDCLTKFLITDVSVAVRLEAMQALVVLGPPVNMVKVPDPQNPAKMINQGVPDPKAAKVYIDRIKARLAPQSKPPEGNATGLVEPHRQVEIWARVVLMRFDRDEITNENLDGIARYIGGPDYGAKIQALAALGLLGEFGAKRIDEVVKALHSDDLSVVSAAVTSLVAMGPAAKPAIPDLEKLEKKFEQMRDERVKKLPANLTAEQVKQLTEAMPEEQLRRGVGEAIKAIKNPRPPGAAMEKKP